MGRIDSYSWNRRCGDGWGRSRHCAKSVDGIVEHLEDLCVVLVAMGVKTGQRVDSFTTVAGLE